MAERSEKTTTGRLFGLLPSAQPLNFLEQNPLPQLPAVHKFPSFSEMVSQQITPSSPSTNEGLFSTLVRDPLVLYREYLDDPERFPQEAGTLLTQLVTQQKDLNTLTPEDMEVLNQATVEFAQHSPEPEPTPEPSKPPHQDLFGEEGEEELEWQPGGQLPTRPAVDLPDTAPGADWWAKWPGKYPGR